MLQRKSTQTPACCSLSLHDALPIFPPGGRRELRFRLSGEPSDPVFAVPPGPGTFAGHYILHRGDRKSKRLNYSHLVISYAVFCLNKKKKCLETVSNM